MKDWNCTVSSAWCVIKHILVTLYVLFSLGYIANDLWIHFKNDELSKAINYWRTSAFTDVVKVFSKDCKSYSVTWDDNKSIDLISTACLQQNKWVGGEISAPTTPPAKMIK